jgi:hypothetical protein
MDHFAIWQFAEMEARSSHPTVRIISLYTNEEKHGLDNGELKSKFPPMSLDRIVLRYTHN